MTRMTSVHLGEHYSGFLTQLTKSGRFISETAAIEAALGLLEHEEAQLGVLAAALNEGEASGESDKSFDALIAEAKAEFYANQTHKI